MSYANREGVIKFQLDFQAGPAPSPEHLQELNAWRDIFRQLNLIGQDPNRYNGLGFGNLSRRLPGQANDAFLISGTQTGHLLSLQPENYATVLDCSPQQNRLKAMGPVQPSSEALSHGILYQAKPSIQWVMHLHSPDIFRQRTRLNLPSTKATANYGTPEMANELMRLAEKFDEAVPVLLVMTGHQDGIIAFGPTASQTGSLIIATLAKSLQGV